MWPADEASYEAFARHLSCAGTLPTYLPWPMEPGWRVTGFAWVGDAATDTVATMTCCSGYTVPDGPVEVCVVTEEPGTGLGARVARTPWLDPGPDAAQGPPVAKVALDGQNAKLWSVSSQQQQEGDRAALVGEAGGRWLWLTVRPASAVLLLSQGWSLRDVSAFGSVLVDLPFGGPMTEW